MNALIIVCSYSKRFLTYEDFYKAMRTACMHHSGKTPVDDADNNNNNNNDGMYNDCNCVSSNNDSERHGAHPSVFNVEKELLNSNLFTSFVKVRL